MEGVYGCEEKNMARYTKGRRKRLGKSKAWFSPKPTRLSTNPATRLVRRSTRGVKAEVIVDPQITAPKRSTSPYKGQGG